MKMHKNQDELLKIEETAAYLNLKKSRIYNLVFQRKMPFIKLGSSLRFSKQDLEAWIKSKRQGVKND